MPYKVLDCGFNRRNYPELIGRVFPERPGLAVAAWVPSEARSIVDAPPPLPPELTRLADKEEPKWN